MKKKPFPFYPLLLAIFPVISLIAYNKFETRLTFVFRPLLVSLLFSLGLFGLFFLIHRKHWHKAALSTGITIILFFSYGHIYNLLESVSFIDPAFLRHRYVVLVLGLLWSGVIIFGFLRDIKPDFSKLMNIFSIILVAMPLFQLGRFYIGEAIASSRWAQESGEETAETNEDGAPPDVYYIVLDMYARPDTLLEQYEIDVTDFVAEMEALGFYYASKSQSNYGETLTSLTTSMNLQLIGEYVQDNNLSSYQDLLIHSETRSMFEDLGYQIVAFATGYRWSELTDADIYYKIRSTDPLRGLTPFELLFFETTIVYPFRGYLFEWLPISNPDATTQSLHIETQRNVLELLPQVAQNNNPTFTFAHILIPHPPFVFNRDGSILEDPGYYSGEKASAINEFYDLDGYTRQVQFISAQILEISRRILEDSENEPIIVIQADHGWKGKNRQKILNLYFFPDQDYGRLYPSITPVNTFRVIFSQFFGMDFELVEDRIILQ